MSKRRRKPGKSRHRTSKGPKSAGGGPAPPSLTPRQAARLLADAAIAWERAGQRERFEESFAQIPGALLALTKLASEPDHWLAREFCTPARAVSEAVLALASRAEGLARTAREAKREDVRLKAVKLVEELQQAASWMYRTVGLHARLLALHTTPTTSDLLVELIGGTLGASHDLPKLLARFETTAGSEGVESENGDSFFVELAQVLVELVGYLESMCERHPERFRYLARELPHWPALVTKHTAGYRKRFERIAGQGFLDLGAECPLDTSPRAMYRLETPVCGLIWELVFRDWLAVSAGVRALRRKARESSQQTEAETERTEIEKAVAWSCETDPEREIFRAAFALGDLNKETAEVWADQFVIPYLRFKQPDWRKLPALAKFMGKKGGDTRAEREIRRAVLGMARA